MKELTKAEEQVMEFLSRTQGNWRKLTVLFALPLNEDTQMKHGAWRTCRDELYQIMKTEETAARLLGSVIKEILPEDG